MNYTLKICVLNHRNGMFEPKYVLSSNIIPRVGECVAVNGEYFTICRVIYQFNEFGAGEEIHFHVKPGV